MTDPLPADVRRYLEDAGAGPGPGALAVKARALLVRYPKPGPVWQPGDVALSDGSAFQRGLDGWFGRGISGRLGIEPSPDADLIARGGRRVHPARFHDHAETLRGVVENSYRELGDLLLPIADDIDPEAAEPEVMADIPAN